MFNFFRKKEKAAARPTPNASRKVTHASRIVPIPSALAEGQSEHVSWGSVQVARKVIETTAELGGIVFSSIVNDEARLSQHLYSSIAIARINETTKDCILFIDKAQATGGEVDAAVALMQERGFKLAEQAIQGYFLTSALVLSLSKKDITNKSLQVDRQIASDPKKNALMSAFTDVVSWAYANKADDIDFALKTEQGMSQIAFKIGGKYVRPDRWLLPSVTMNSMLSIAWQKSQGGTSAQFDTKIEQQALVRLSLPQSVGNPDGAEVRLRWSGMAIDKGTVVTMRIQRLGTSALIKSLDQAGYVQNHMEIIQRVLHSEGGMVVLAGVVGSGKSTTLVQMINMLPRDIKIQSLEDPVELDIPGAYQKTIVRDLSSAGADESFASATKALYRSALDVLYLGEIRDQATGLVGRQVVESGHSVYTTTHARSGLGIIDRFASPAIGMPRDVLATPGIIKLLVYQSLLPTNCPHCAKSPLEYAKAFSLSGQGLQAHQEYFDRLERLYGVDRSTYRLRDHTGCSECRKHELPELNGLSGRTVVAEMIEPDEEMLGYIFRSDNIGRDRYWRSMASNKFDDTNLVGKTAMECAIFKAIRGKTLNGATFGNIDPREIEPRFMSFETVEFKRRQDKSLALRQNTSSISVPPTLEADGVARQAANSASTRIEGT